MIRQRKTYQSCVDLPLFNFIKIVVYDHLEWLYVEPKSIWLVDYPKIAAVWEKVFDEYSKLSKNTTSSQVLSLYREISFLNNKLFLIQSLVDYLSKYRSEEMILLLKSQGFHYTYSPETIDNDLKLTISSAKTLVIRLKQSESDLNDHQGEEESASEQDYIQLLTELGKYQGSRLDPKEISVSEFVAIMNRFKRDNAPKNKVNG